SPEHYRESWGDISERGVILRHGALHSVSQWMFFLGAQRLSMFQKTMCGIKLLGKDLELEYRAFHTGVRWSDKNVGEGNPVVRDPVVAKAKGAPKIAKKKTLGKRRRCTSCKGTEHTKRNCPEKGEKRQQQELRGHAFEGDGVYRPDRVDECEGFNATGLMANDDWELIVGDNLCVDPGG
ncbi:hypothetical protein S245_038122, partial [Arachis hypogaea]